MSILTSMILAFALTYVSLIVLSKAHPAKEMSPEEAAIALIAALRSKRLGN